MKYDKLKKLYLDFINEINPIGFEIKAQRTKLDQTLTSVCYKLMSPSYLCKVENNQASLKNIYVKEVCKRLYIEPDKIGFMNNSKDKIEEAMLAYLLDQKQVLEKLVNEGNGLLNYVYKLIKTLYYLSIDKISDAKDELKDIETCIKSINAHDLKYICAIYIAFDYKTSRLDLAYEGVMAITYMEPSRLLELFANYFGLKIYLIWNNPKLSSFMEYFKFNPYARSFSYIFAKVNYYYELSCIKRNKDYEIDKLSLVDYPELLRNLNIFKNFMNHKMTIKPSNKTPLFLRILYDYGIGKNIKEEIKELDGYILDVDYSKLYLEYLIEPEETKLDFLISRAIPYVKNTRSDFLKRYLMSQAVILAEKYKRYKLIYEIYLDLNL